MQRTTRIPQQLLEADLTDKIIWAFYEVYKTLGFGFLESTYASALAVELRRIGLSVAREVPIEVLYKGVAVGQFRYDMIVNDRVIVEIKSQRTISEADERQIQNYLKASNVSVGLLLHFGPSPKVRRFIWTQSGAATA
jgi:GxxExxY protein